MAIKFDITGDNSNFLGALQGVESGVRNTAKTVEAAGGDIEGMFKRISQAAAGMFASFSAGQIVKTIVQTRGEFQQLEVAFQTMLGSAEKATTMVKDLQTLAATTPFDMKGVSEGAKQLLAYGVAADDIVDTMRRLGDVAAGLSLPLTDLAWLYGTTLTQGRMFTMDLRQFQARGIPMAEELAKIFGVTKNEVAGLVTAGKVTSKEVVAAIKAMTDEGSKFGGLMEAQSHTITGQISNIEDTISMMFNDVGKTQEGVINDALAGVSTLVDHWQQVAKVVGTVIVSYGLYKGVLMATIALENARAKLNYNKQVDILNKEIAATKALIPVKGQEKNADLAAMVAKKQLTQAQAEEIAMKRQELEATKQQIAANKLAGGLDAQIEALKALKPLQEGAIAQDLQEAVASGTITAAQAQEIQSKRELLATLTQEARTRVANLQAKAYEAQMNLQNARQNQAEAQSAMDAANEKVQAAREAMDAAVQSGNADEQAAAKTQMGEAINEAYTAQQNLKAASTEVASAETAANTATEAANSAQTEFNTVVQGANTTAKNVGTTATVANTTATKGSTIAMRLHSISAQAAAIADGILAAAVNGLKTAWNGLKVAMATNPIGLILTGLTVAISLFTSFVDTTDKAAEASKRFGEDANKEIGNINVLVSTMENISSTTNTYHNAMDQLNDELQKYNLGLVDENTSTAELIKKKEELIEKINEERDARVKANAIDTMNENYNSQVEEADQKFLEALKDAEHIDKVGFAYWDSDDIQDIADSLKEILNAKIKSEIPDIMKLDDDARQQAIDNLRQELTKIMTDAGVSEYDASFVKGSWNWTDGVWNDALYEQINRLMEISEYWEENTGKVKDYNDEVEKTSPTIAEEFGQSEDTMKEFFEEMEREMIWGEADASSYNGMLSALVPEDLDPMGAFDKLHTLEDVTKQKIDEINSRKIMMSVDYTNLYGLNNFLIEIQNRLNNIINGTGGATAKNDLNTIDGINAELKSVNEELGKAQIGSQRYKDLVKYRDNLKKKIPQDATYHAPKNNKNKNKKSGKSAEDLAYEQARDEANYRATIAEQQRETARTAVDMELETRQAILDARKESSEKELAQAELDFDKEKIQIERWYEDLKATKIKNAEQLFNANPKNKKKVFDPNSVDTTYTKAETAERDARLAANESKYRQTRDKVLKDETDAMTEYLKAYGSMQEQRLAIAKEYDDKIALAQTEGERLSLNAQKARALSDFDISNAKTDMGWDDLFGNLGSMTQQQLATIKKQLNDLLSSNSLDIQGYKDVVDQIDQVNEAILTAEDKQRGFLGVAVSYNTERRKLEMDVADALERQNQAMQSMGNASATLTIQRFSTQQLLSGYGFNMPQSQIKASNATSILQKVGAKYGTDSTPYKKVKDALDKLAKSEIAYNDTVKKKKKADDEATQKQSKLNKYLSDFSEKLKDIMPLLEQINSNIQDLPGLLSEFGVSEDSSLGKAAQGLADGTNSAMSAMQDYMSGNYVGAAMNGMKAVGSYVSAGINMFAGAGNTKAMEEEIAKLSEANDDLANAIDGLKDSIEDSDNTNQQSVDAYNKAISAEKERENNQKTMMNDRASEYSNSGHGFLGMGGRHSFNKYANDNRGAWLSAFNAALRQNGYKGNLRSAEDVWRLSPEEMKILRDFSPEAWTKFFNSGGESNPKELAEQYIEMAGQLEELTDSLNEKLTGYSWDSFRDSYSSLIKDLTSTTDDFGDHINEVLTNAILEALMNSLYADRIKEIYQMIADAAADGVITAQEAAAIRAKNEALSKDMLNTRQQAIDQGLIIPSDETEEQSASANGVSEITYDQANTFIGLVTAGNIVRQNIADGVTSMVSNLSMLASSASARNTALSEMRNLMIYNNSYLEDILKINKSFYNDFVEKMDMNNKYLKEMK